MIVTHHHARRALPRGSYRIACVCLLVALGLGCAGTAEIAPEDIGDVTISYLNKANAKRKIPSRAITLFNDKHSAYQAYRTGADDDRTGDLAEFAGLPQDRSAQPANPPPRGRSDSTVSVRGFSGLPPNLIPVEQDAMAALLSTFVAEGFFEVGMYVPGGRAQAERHFRSVKLTQCLIVTRNGKTTLLYPADPRKLRDLRPGELPQTPEESWVRRFERCARGFTAVQAHYRPPTVQKGGTSDRFIREQRRLRDQARRDQAAATRAAGGTSAGGGSGSGGGSGGDNE